MELEDFSEKTLAAIERFRADTASLSFLRDIMVFLDEERREYKLGTDSAAFAVAYSAGYFMGQGLSLEEAEQASEFAEMHGYWL